jgi:hypothetical protein
MKEKTGTFAALTAALLVGGTLGVSCGGRLTTSEMGETGGSGGSAQTGGSAGNGGAGGSTGGTGGAGGSTGGTGATGGTDGTGGSTGGTGGTGGSTGGTGGGAGKGGAAGSGGGTTPPGTIACGTSICRPITGGLLGTLPPCCPMDTPNACGAEIPVAPGVCFTSTPGVADPRCPTIQVMGASLTGCCRPNGLCGVSLQVIGLGCSDPVTVGGMPAGRCGAGR